MQKRATTQSITSKDLRGKLMTILDGVISGEIDDAIAKTAIKAAAQINESQYAEVKVNRMKFELQQKALAFGDLEIATAKKES